MIHVALKGVLGFGPNLVNVVSRHPKESPLGQKDFFLSTWATRGRSIFLLYGNWSGCSGHVWAWIKFLFFCLKGDQKLSRYQLKKIWIGPFFDPFGPSFAKKHLYSAWPHGLAKIAIFFKTSKSSDNYSYFRLIMPISWAKKKKLLKTESTKIGHFWPWKICLFGAAFHGMEMKRVSKNGIF